MLRTAFSGMSIHITCGGSSGGTTPRTVPILLRTPPRTPRLAQGFGLEGAAESGRLRGLPGACGAGASAISAGGGGVGLVAATVTPATPATAAPIDAGAPLMLLAGGAYPSTCEATWRCMNNTVHSISIVQASPVARRIKRHGLHAGFDVRLEPHAFANPATPVAEAALLSRSGTLFCVLDFTRPTAEELSRFPENGDVMYDVSTYLDTLAAAGMNVEYVQEITA
ncbi:hypothetical protein DFH27DRAFT_613461 [Peziza echinospora]|nr:hypothetical protein DFH27DRAFT_613461 [Peziza echinospora]